MNETDLSVDAYRDIFIQILLNIIDIFCLHIFLLILSYCRIDFRWEIIDIFSIIVYFPSTFCPTLGHHQGTVYYKSDVTFVCTLLLCKKKSIWAVAVCSVYSYFPPNTIKSIRQYGRINKKICRQKMSIIFNEICINGEMLPKYTHTHTHVYIYIYNQ